MFNKIDTGLLFTWTFDTGLINKMLSLKNKKNKRKKQKHSLD